MDSNLSMLRTIASLVFFAASSSPAASQCLDWGKEFGPGGLSGHVRSSIVWDDGTGAKLYVGGQFDANGDLPLRGIATWDGTSWAPVGTGLGGTSPGTSGAAFAFAIFDDGSGEALYVGGQFAEAGGNWAGNIAKWDGNNWSALGAGVSSPGVLALAVYDNGSGPTLYAGGQFHEAGSVSALRIAKWNGSTWSSVGGGLNGAVYALAVYDGGSGPALYAGCPFQSAGVFMRKWNGTSWSNVGTLDGDVKALKVFDDGSGPKLYAGGEFLTAGGLSAKHVARWNGSSWSALGAGVGDTVNEYVYAFEVFDDGSGPVLGVGGAFLDAGGSPANYVASWNGSAWSALADGASNQVFTMTAFDGGSGAELYTGGASDGDPYLSGIGTFARWNGSTWSGVANRGEGFNAQVSSLVAHDDGSGPSLFAGGEFTKAGGVSCNRIARWDGAHWHALGSGMSGNGLTDGVTALVVFDDGGGPALFAAGDFGSAGGVGASNIARWDGSAWSALDSGLADYASALAVFDDGSGPALYVGGVFQTVGSAALPARYIAKWNGTSWSSIGDMSARVTALAVFDDGSGVALYAGGYFTAAGGISASRIAKWNGSTWSALGSGTSSQIYALATYDGGSGTELYAGGNFSTAGGLAVKDLAKWNGSAWSALGVGLDGVSIGGISPYVKALVVFDDGTGSALYATGRFDTAGGTSAKSIARWDGLEWSPLGEGITKYSDSDQVGSALAVYDDGSGHGQQLYAGGAIRAVGGAPSYDLARWGPCEPGLGYCFGDDLDPVVTTDCPCGNFGNPGHGCANFFFASGAQLTALGTTSPNTVVFTCDDVPNNTLCTFLRGGRNVREGFVFADGVRCVNPPLLRFGQQNSGQNGNPPHTVASGVISDAPGTTRFYQCQYRNPTAGYCDPGLFNVSNGYKLVW